MGYLCFGTGTRYQHAVFPIEIISDRMVAVKVRTSLGVILMIAWYVCMLIMVTILLRMSILLNWVFWRVSWILMFTIILY